MFSGPWSKIARKSREKSKSPNGSAPLRFCCQTRKITEPGRYSQRSTAFPRRERKLKLGSPSAKEGDDPGPSGSIVVSPPGSRWIVPRLAQLLDVPIEAGHDVGLE